MVAPLFKVDETPTPAQAEIQELMLAAIDNDEDAVRRVVGASTEPEALVAVALFGVGQLVDTKRGLARDFVRGMRRRKAGG